MEVLKKESKNSESKTNKLQPFGKEWWDQFYLKTNGLSAAAVFKNVLSPEDIDSLNSCLVNVIKDVCAKRINEGLMVSIDGDANFDNREFFFENPPIKDENLIEWCDRVYGKKKYGIILNSCQNHDRHLKGLISTKFNSLLANYGTPPHGLEITLFFGNYGYTPLGFHIDPLGHKVTHLHLGPGAKEMYLIEKEKFETEFGVKSGRKEYDKLIPKSEKYEFGEKDLFFMPNEFYHVGKSDELSFALTVWHVEPPVVALQKRLSIELAERIFVGEESGALVTADKNGVGNISHLLNCMSDVIGIDPEYANLTLKECLEQLILETRYRLFSNGFFFGFHQNQGSQFAVPDLSMNSYIKGVAPFVIYSLRRGNKDLLFVQGKIISIPKSKEIKEILMKINSYKPFKIKVIFKSLLKKWDNELILSLCGEVYRWGGIEKIE